MSSERVRYAKELDESLPADVHPYGVLRMQLKAGQRVLDVGCGSGEVGAYLMKAGLTVDGVEADAERAAAARSRLRRVALGWAGPNLDGATLEPPYDAVVFVDVLEHVDEPGPTIEWARNMIGRHGRVFAVVPNSAHLRFRRKMLRGDWSYDTSGLFDRGHVRFYDVHTMTALPVGHGLREVRRWYFPTWTGRRQGIKRVLVRRWPNLVAYSVLLEWAAEE